MSAGYKGQGVQNLMKSDGAVVNFRPSPQLGLSYSYNYASTNMVNTLESEDKFFNDITAQQQSVDVSEASINRQLHEAQVRWYPMGGSFFFGASAMAGTFDGRYSESVVGSDVKTDKEYSGTTTYSSFALGNIWEFKHIMVGAEWAGLSKNMSNSQKVSTSGGGTSESSADKSYQDYLRVFTASDSASLLMMHLGISL